MSAVNTDLASGSIPPIGGGAVRSGLHNPSNRRLVSLLGIVAMAVGVIILLSFPIVI